MAGRLKPSKPSRFVTKVIKALVSPTEAHARVTQNQCTPSGNFSALFICRAQGSNSSASSRCNAAVAQNAAPRTLGQNASTHDRDLARLSASHKNRTKRSGPRYTGALNPAPWNFGRPLPPKNNAMRFSLATAHGTNHTPPPSMTEPRAGSQKASNLDPYVS